MSKNHDYIKDLKNDLFLYFYFYVWILGLDINVVFAYGTKV